MAATLIQLLPPLALLPGWRDAPPARRWIGIWCLVFFVSDLLQIVILLSRGPNLWFFTYVDPVEDSILLWALSFWQPGPVMRLAVRVAIPLIVATYIGISFAAGETASFRTFSGPFRAVTLMACAAYTMVVNFNRTPDRVLEQDWLWTCLGILLYFGLLALTDPILSAMGRDQLAAMRRIYDVRAVGDVLAFVLVWRGMRCPILGSSSGST